MMGIGKIRDFADVHEKRGIWFAIGCMDGIEYFESTHCDPHLRSSKAGTNRSG